MFPFSEGPESTTPQQHQAHLTSKSWLLGVSNQTSQGSLGKVAKSRTQVGYRADESGHLVMPESKKVLRDHNKTKLTVMELCQRDTRVTERAPQWPKLEKIEQQNK